MDHHLFSVSARNQTMHCNQDHKIHDVSVVYKPHELRGPGTVSLIFPNKTGCLEHGEDSKQVFFWHPTESDGASCRGAGRCFKNGQAVCMKLLPDAGHATRARLYSTLLTYWKRLHPTADGTGALSSKVSDKSHHISSIAIA